MSHMGDPIPYDSRVQGKCTACKIRVIWHRRGGPPLSAATCPRCHQKLSRTSHLLHWPTVIAQPIDGILVTASPDYVREVSMKP